MSVEGLASAVLVRRSGKTDHILTIMAVTYRQSWYREYQINLGEAKVEIVGRFEVEDCTECIVNDMKEKLNLENYRSHNQWEPFFKDLVDQIERVGILVMQNSVVGSNVHRKLNVQEFHGFGIVDDYAPAIFINKADAHGAQLFTLLHEAAHIWLNKSGISDGKQNSQNKIERKCNEIAAEFLVPKDQFLDHWRKYTENWERNLRPLSKWFHVSQWVIARRASEFNLISSDQYWSFVKELMDEKRRYSSKGGPNPHVMRTQRVSRRVARAVVSEALCGKLLLRDAWRLIEIKPNQLRSYAESLQL